jgi:hypothetical protein
MPTYTMHSRYLSQVHTPFVRNEPNFAPPRAAGGGNCAKRSQTWGNWGMWAEAVSLWGVVRPGSKTCETNPISPTEGRRRRVNVQNKANLARLRTRAGGEMRETNPISARRGRPTEGIVQNEAKLRATGVCGQRRSACGAWPGRGVKRAKRTQFRPPRAGAGG